MNLEDKTSITNFPKESGQYKVVQIEIDGSLYLRFEEEYCKSHAMIVRRLLDNLKIPYSEAAPSAFIGASNFFELSVAVALILFGMNSGATLATVVGVLTEVPVMLHLVKIMKTNKEKFNFKSYRI